MTLNGFSWVRENEIAGMSRPLGRAEGLWAWLAERNVGLVVSLTTQPPDADLLATQGIDLLHLPVPDFSAPSDEVIEEFLARARFYRHEGKAIVVHCGAGIGRTGTMIACYLVDQGMEPADAIELVRKKRPGSVETPEQERAVYALAERAR